MAGVKKRFTSSGYLVRGAKVLLVNHRRFQLWLPIGGHIEPDEDPVETLCREAREETGFQIEIVAERPGIQRFGTNVQPAPVAMLMYDIRPGPVLIDLVYFVRPVGGTQRLAASEHRAMRWFDREALRHPSIPDNVRLLGTQAIDLIAHSPPPPSVQSAHECGSQRVAGVDKHFTSTGFLVRDGKVLLVNHRKLRMWLPFGGHIEPNEDPVEALHREAREETGFEIEIVAERPEIDQRGVHVLPAPETILLEDIEPGHIHIDLIYFVRPVGGAQRLASNEHSEMRWFDREALNDEVITADVRLLGTQAIDRIEGRNGA
ncbi:MAG: NUDIX domain-containing protein [Chloroflexota bacterium]|nr:NUDIX domain-containing protein [Chloroflexota bacterium]